MKRNRITLGTLSFLAVALLAVSCADPIMPSPDFTFEIDDKTVTFTNTSMDATSYSWDFGDESAAVTTENATHTYEAYGDYTVRLTATNEEGSKISNQTISVVKEWPAITIDGDFADWDAVETFYVGDGVLSGNFLEAKVTSDAAGSKLYVYIKGTINADFPVIQILVDADGDATTGWQTPDDYAANGSEYQFECFAADQWGGLYPWVSDEGMQDWPWDATIASDDDGDDVFTNSALVGNEIEFALETSLMKDPVLASQIGLIFWQQPSDWSATSGSLPALMTDPLSERALFSFQ